MKASPLKSSALLKKLVSQQQHFGVAIVSHPEIDHYLSQNDKEYLKKLAEPSNAQIQFSSDDRLHLNDFHFYSTTSGKRLEV